jgi:hypothetical protein
MKMNVKRLASMIGPAAVMLGIGLTGALPASAATHHSKRHRRHHVTHIAIPQHNGGDRDADNNGGPSDGDGNV